MQGAACSTCVIIMMHVHDARVADLVDMTAPLLARACRGVHTNLPEGVGAEAVQLRPREHNAIAGDAQHAPDCERSQGVVACAGSITPCAQVGVHSNKQAVQGA